MYRWTRESIVHIGFGGGGGGGRGLFAPSGLLQEEALNGAVIDRPKSDILFLLPALTLMGNERYGWLCVFVTSGQEGEGFGAQAMQIKFGSVHSCLTRDWPRARGLPLFIKTHRPSS